MAASDDIERLIAERDSAANAEAQRTRLEHDAVSREIIPAWESYKQTCTELAEVLGQSNVPGIPLYRRTEKQVGFFSRKTEIIYPKFGMGWGLGPHEECWNLFGILSTDGTLYRRLRFSERWKYTYSYIPFDMPLFDHEGVVYDTGSSVDYWKLSVKDGRLQAQVVTSPDSTPIYKNFDMENVIKELVADSIMRYR